MNAPDAMIPVQLDGAPRHVPRGTTLAALVAQLGFDSKAVTTAVNGRFVPRPQRDALVLSSGDAIVLFQPIVGG